MCGIGQFAKMEATDSLNLSEQKKRDEAQPCATCDGNKITFIPEATVLEGARGGGG